MKEMKKSLQECLASRKDCSGGGHYLPMAEVLEICKSTFQSVPSKTLFIVLPDGKDYKGGIYKYEGKEGLIFITDKEKTNYCMELYPELIWKESLELKDLINVGLILQYLSLKVESMGLGVSQRARPPKNVNKLVNNATNLEHVFVYSVAVQERDRSNLVEDTLEPLQIELEEPKEGIHLLDTPDCYKNRAIYKNDYKGVPLDAAIFDKVEKKSPDHSSLHELSQLLWACQGETDHATHGNRDALEKNGYGRVHATGCAGYAVYPLIFVDKLASLPKGSYWYNSIGFSGLNRWFYVNKELHYDHLIHEFTSDNAKADIEKEFGFKISNYVILLCIDRKKPCSGFAHSTLGKMFMNTKYWAEIEAGMALAGLQLQANALGLNWQEIIISNPDDPKYKKLFNLESAERSINNMALKLVNLPKNEKLSLKGNLIPIVLFFIQ